jgi:hypothetical protein
MQPITTRKVGAALKVEGPQKCLPIRIQPKAYQFAHSLFVVTTIFSAHIESV